MIFNYLFLSSRFDSFAYQAELLRAISPQFKDTKSHALYNTYVNCRAMMAYRMMEFNNKTSTLLGWFKSFIPTTVAYHARKQLGAQLQTAHKLFLDLSLDYLKSPKSETIRNEVKADDKLDKKNTNTKRPVVWKKHYAELDNKLVKNNLSVTGMWSLNNFKRI